MDYSKRLNRDKHAKDIIEDAISKMLGHDYRKSLSPNKTMQYTYYRVSSLTSLFHIFFHGNEQTNGIKQQP